MKCLLLRKPSLCTKISLGIFFAVFSVLIVIIIYLLTRQTNDDVQTKLVMAAIIFRHGNRSPISPYRNDPHIKYDWPGGFAALSQNGTLQAYTLGKTLRLRYNSLVPNDGLYTKDNIRILSSPAERCIMTGQGVLAGFLAPMATNTTLPIKWQPTAIAVLQEKEDILIAQVRSCKKYDDIINKSLLTDPLNKKYKDIFPELSKYTGENISTVSDVTHLYDTLNVESSIGLKLPNWTNKLYPDKMIPFLHRYFTIFTDTSYMKRVKGGPLITEVFNNMLAKRNNSLEPDRNIFFYSGHDTTLSNVMNSLNVFNQTPPRPDYAATFAFELHENSLLSNDVEVKLIYYVNSECVEPKFIKIPDCDEPCSLTKFGKSIEHLLITSFDEACNDNK